MQDEIYINSFTALKKIDNKQYCPGSVGWTALISMGLYKAMHSGLISLVSWGYFQGFGVFFLSFFCVFVQYIFGFFILTTPSPTQWSVL
jgi:hypothetical protein